MENDLNALILVGGKSSRMGTSKAHIAWWSIPQYQYLIQIFSSLKLPVFLSGKASQRNSFTDCHNYISDSLENKGPSTGIISAYICDPQKAWLVIACDVPMINEECLLELIQKRNPEKLATSFISPFDGKPEPLIAIWEPKGIKQLQSEIGCPRNFLMKNIEKIKLITPSKPELISNTNTPEDANYIHSLLHKLKNENQ